MLPLDQALQELTWLIYLAIFVAVAVRTVRLPTRGHLDMLLFFAGVMVIAGANSVFATLNVAQPAWLMSLTGAVFMLLPALMMRLVADFQRIPRWVAVGTVVGTLVGVLDVLTLSARPSRAGLLLLVLIFALITGYAIVAFARQAVLARGVTRRRMQAVSVGSACLVLVLVFAGAQALAPAIGAAAEALLRLMSVASGVSYAIGFAPPTWLRRAWQEPELRAFLARAASLPRLPETRAIVRELEQGAARAVGAPGATIGLWDADAQALTFWRQQPVDAPRGPSGHAQLDDASDRWQIPLDTQSISARCFVRQQPLFERNMARRDPANAAAYRAYHAEAALAAPIRAGDKSLGALVVFAEREPIFAQSDLELVQLLAEQAAVILESRALIDEATRVRAREESARLKEDFLSSVAHDLKTPLTAILTQTQLLLRKAQRQPEAPADPDALERLLGQERRLRDLVLEVLDVSRLENGQLPLNREPTDLAALAAEVAAMDRPGAERIRFQAEGPMIANVDPIRLRQVVENLVENALKYSPGQQEVTVRVWKTDAEAGLSVQDHGIGIPHDEMPRVFERFFRADNVNDRTFAGIGLGLYICKGIVEQHGGQISVASEQGAGSTFTVQLPLAVDARPGETAAAEVASV